ncbi:regulatory protein RecX [Gordonia hirsuta DSM 44140 = NBRC 16056]|uniref:Regulatory protein RecX n=1 Tax=Gordonia hirsuta DSM 44140 = NBRC 16056 TaxID=1121927 RepID=L7LEQ9_9ACTN|nr:regulatory protein RecX [Gordonia hirsuta]GAC58552.1 regulatory protein RecX [Gordonia hirsuta DSM 44140 = NBRC 16056]
MTEKTGPSAWDAALRLLGVRARSRVEIAQRLAQREFDAATIDEVLARLESAGLIDDDEFAREWAHSRHRHSGRGRLALRRELRTKGVAAETIEEALAQIEPEDERAQAAEIAAKKLASSSLDLDDHADRAKAYRRLAGVLGRRGFPPEMISSVVSDTIRAAR